MVTLNDANTATWGTPTMFVSRRPPGALGPRMSEHPIGEIAHAFRQAWGIPEIVTGPVFLGVAAAATCGRYTVTKDQHGAFPLGLYIAALSDPGTLKSPLLSAAARPLKEAQIETARTLDPQILARLMKITAIEKALAKVTADMSAKMAKGQPIHVEEAQAEGLRMDLAHLQAEGEFTAPFRPISWGTDATPEAVVTRAGTQGGRAALLSAEAGLLENIAGRYSEGAVKAEFFNSAYDAEPYEGSRVGDPGRDIPRPWATILQVIQPSAARIMLDSRVMASRGFLARWLLFVAPPTPYVARTTMPDPDPAVLAGWSRAINGIWHGPDWTSRHHIEVPQSARSIFTGFELETIAPAMRIAQTEGATMMMNWLGKLAMTTWRIAGLLALVRNPAANVVTDRAAHQAIELSSLAMAHMDYLIAHGPEATHTSPRYQVLKALVEGSVGFVGPNSGDPSKQETWIRVTNDRCFTKRDVHARFKDSKWCQNVEDVEAVLQDLAHLGWVRFVTKQTTAKGGRPSEIWEHHPDLEHHFDAMTGGAR